MKNIQEYLVNESSRAVTGNILEVSLRGDGKFFWRTPKDNDWDDDFTNMKDWEIRKSNETIFIKIGDLKDLNSF